MRGTGDGWRKPGLGEEERNTRNPPSSGARLLRGAPIAPLVVIIKKHDRDLADQLRRAANSVLLCTGEAQRRARGDRTHLFRTAAGSCDECNSALDGANGWGIALDDKKARALIDRELGLLYGLVHGPRHLRHARG